MGHDFHFVLSHVLFVVELKGKALVLLLVMLVLYALQLLTSITRNEGLSCIAFHFLCGLVMFATIASFL